MSRAAYSEEEVRRWLGWLARGMQLSGQSVFVIEQLQPMWLAKWPRRRFNLASVILQFSMLIVPVWAISALMVLLTLANGTPRMPRLGGLGGLVVLALLALGAFGLAGGFGAVLIVKRISRRKAERIRLVERLSWSWSGFARGFWRTNFGCQPYWWVIMLPFAVHNGFTEAIAATEIPLKTQPDKGFRLSTRNSMIFLVAPTVLAGIALPWIALPFAFALGLHMAAWYGGFDAIDHWLLRRQIVRLGHTPRDYVAFLDYAAHELGFLQKAGGGYLFMHRQLLEYFAEET